MQKARRDVESPEALAQTWLKQARRNLGACNVMLENEYFEGVCFHSQQAAARSLMSVIFLGGGRRIDSPSCIRLMGQLKKRHPSLSPFKESAGLLDQVYTSSRYPDDELEVAPYELFSRSQAEDLLARSTKIVEEAARIIHRHTPPSP